MASPSPEDNSDPEPGSDEEGDENSHEDIEVDEVSDDEDDRHAHQILQAVPDQVNAAGGGSLISLPYDNYNFAVRFPIRGHGVIADCILHRS